VPDRGDCDSNEISNDCRAISCARISQRAVPSRSGKRSTIAAAGFDCALVARILKVVDTNEFKRRQAAPTIRVSNKAFGSGRQLPIAQRWRREPAKWVR
jgi:hypothetical protein